MLSKIVALSQDKINFLISNLEKSAKKRVKSDEESTMTNYKPHIIIQKQKQIKPNVKIIFFPSLFCHFVVN